MSDDPRQRIFDAILASIGGADLPAAQTEPLVAALSALFEKRPNAVDKVQAPLGRALRNPTFPGLWEQCAAHIPSGGAYAELHAAASGIATYVNDLPG